MLSGSFRATGMDTFERSFPMFLHSRFHKDRPSRSGRGAGSLVRLPVRHLGSSSSPASTTANSKLKCQENVNFEFLKKKKVTLV
jgi:hypothetical protein